MPTTTPHKYCVEVVLAGLPTPLYYSGTEEERTTIIGHKVTIELGRRKTTGWAVGVHLVEKVPALSDKKIKLKPIIESTPVFLAEQIPLFKWMSAYYATTLATVLDTAIPRVKNRKRKSREKKNYDRVFSYAEPKLTILQEQAVKKLNIALDKNEFAPYLLYGVTGSGKTEIYLQAIRYALAQNKTALVLVPEISLTPQLIDRFESRLNSPLGVLHSQLSELDKWEMWHKILNGELKVVVGARSAVFAPLKDLGIIIVDEEHDASFKQSDNLRYNGRDIAVLRGKFANCPVVLGSATPSFESLNNVLTKRYKIIELPERATTNPLPTIEIVDMTKIKRSALAARSLSPELYNALSETLEKKEQAIILYNKRGFASFMQCTTCGEIISCPNCSVSLTYHKGINKLLCHYCDLTIAPPQFCSLCRNPKTTRLATDAKGKPLAEDDTTDEIGELKYRGSGTEHIFETLQELFPQANLLRMDRDTTKSLENYRDILSAMHSKKADILVGTQMIAKGHDIPGVTLVGIINADIGLSLPDFRANERVFQLLTQVAGRAGRGGEKGRVLIQTYQPRNPTLQAIAEGKFNAFARAEMAVRKSLNYPPHGKLLRVIISSENKEFASGCAQSVTSYIQAFRTKLQLNENWQNSQIKILGPAPCPIELVRNRYRQHLIIKSDSAKVLSIITNALNSFKPKAKKDLRIVADIDPVDMM